MNVMSSNNATPVKPCCVIPTVRLVFSIFFICISNSFDCSCINVTAISDGDNEKSSFIPTSVFFPPPPPLPPPPVGVGLLAGQVPQSSEHVEQLSGLLQ